MKEIYKKQIDFQNYLIKNGKYDNEDVTFPRDIVLPNDNKYLFKYHMLQIMSELGEVLESDKRWKSYRNSKFDFKNKKEEIADCFIVLMNIAMCSGLTCEELYKSIEEKINKNVERVENEK